MEDLIRFIWWIARICAFCTVLFAVIGYLLERPCWQSGLGFQVATGFARGLVVAVIVASLLEAVKAL